MGTVVGGLLAWSPWGDISWRSLPWASGVPDRCEIFVGRYRPQIPRAFGCQKGLALADLGCTVDLLDPTPANLIPPSSFAVSCDLKALWPGVLGWWGMGGRCTTWPINPPEVYTSFGPDPPGRQAAGCPCQSIGPRLCSQSRCADVGWSVCGHCLLLDNQGCGNWDTFWGKFFHLSVCWLP